MAVATLLDVAVSLSVDTDLVMTLPTVDNGHFIWMSFFLKLEYNSNAPFLLKSSFQDHFCLSVS